MIFLKSSRIYREKIKNYLDLDENIYLIRCKHYRDYTEYPMNNKYSYIFYFSSGINIQIKWDYKNHENISNNISEITDKTNEHKVLEEVEEESDTV